MFRLILIKFLILLILAFNLEFFKSGLSGFVIRNLQFIVLKYNYKYNKYVHLPIYSK